MKDSARSYEFAMSFVAASEKYRAQFVDRWKEVVANFAVEPNYIDGGYSKSPYTYTKQRGGPGLDKIVLKDPETHKAVMTYAAKLVRTVLGDPGREFVKAKPRGYEDAPQKAPTASKLISYAFGLPGHFRTMVEAIVDMLLFGTSIVEVNWCYEEREMPVREVVSELGVETETYTRARVPVYDDVKLTVLDVNDFYPDPTRYRIQDMAGCAKKFRMNAIEARYKAASGIYDSAAVERAIGNLAKNEGTGSAEVTSFRAGLDQPQTRQGVSQFQDMIGYEYWGNVPWEDDAGSSRRVITVLNNEVVRDEPYPLADPSLPFHALVINPVQGRFYGISPAEVIRYDQDFADVVKSLLARAIVRKVHPPIAFEPDADIDTAALKAWKPDALIAARGGPAAIGALRYDADINGGFAMLMGLKDSMQGASGAQGGIQGEEGPDRESATVGAQRIQMAMDRPELAAMMLEMECMPAIGSAILRRYQQFLPDTEALKLRVGEQPEPIWLGDIMGDYDVSFLGSRMLMSKQQKLQAWDRLVATSQAVPPFMLQIPWDQIGREFIGDVLELPEIAARMADPMTMMLNALLAQAAGGGAGGPAQNGVPQGAEQPGMMPAQAAGGMGDMGGMGMPQ
jgi:hypothetical protein